MKFFKNIRAFSAFALSFFVNILFVSIAFAATTDCTGRLCNPLDANFSTIPKFIAGALKVMVEVALPIITLFFVYSGFLFIKAQGNTTELTTAKKNFIYVVIGALLILGAWIIATMIEATIGQLVAN
ncbi:MAG: hypothetical protein UY70_C0001G0022 [Candidatus Kaiserbacteria bacterium GW2011_GWB1_52_6]|uniref:TrbC/VIRB2 family protein n=3 Tax=Candidatus Kaiseribacteriota TaxID=1752734 RepID=A0A0G1XJX0_9BACT|nr:MAG: hypothetical protein UY67_C0007G0022 [Candidatus Kaiserbacteria bacterium GW2011_GWA2_52_12]KKW28186.1 MAG: hypothetical protein UY70_C0001G0022 [Candidatus Kaiserbacteria bacterium GW2011_GWB1_52_6]KKW31155.1 MAG: hypothetical protein UY74_C0022G0011 [Candidatus Kaiserbacteria bacterium GW2011_GWC2_52_8b]